MIVSESQPLPITMRTRVSTGCITCRLKPQQRRLPSEPSVAVQSLSCAQCFWLCALQHTQLPPSSASSGVCSSLCPLSRWCHPTISSSVIPLSSCFQSFLASRYFLELALHIRWPKYWSFSISPSNEWIFRMISFRTDLFHFLVVQGTLKSLLQHYNSKTSILQRSAFLVVQLSHPCMTTGKTIAFKKIYFFLIEG